MIDSGDEKDEEAVEARHIVSLIKEKLQNAYVDTREGKRRAQPSDFCILLRSKAKTAPFFVRELKAADIPVSCDSSESFFETPEIKTVVSYLKIIDNPMRDIELLSVMMSELFGFSAEEVSRLRIDYGRKTTLYANVLKACENGNEKCIFLVKKLRSLKRLAACSTVDMLLREIYSDSSYMHIAGAMTDGETRKKNLLKLLML